MQIQGVGGIPASLKAGNGAKQKEDGRQENDEGPGVSILQRVQLRCTLWCLHLHLQSLTDMFPISATQIYSSKSKQKFKGQNKIQKPVVVSFIVNLKL